MAWSDKKIAEAEALHITNKNTQVTPSGNPDYPYVLKNKKKLILFNTRRSCRFIMTHIFVF